MKIEILTLFPGMCDAVLSESIIGRARALGLVEIGARDIRAYTKDKHRRTDDSPYGGGYGMVMQCQPRRVGRAAALRLYEPPGEDPHPGPGQGTGAYALPGAAVRAL
jgi:tRNA (guanine-N1)-methyltransferase